MTRRLLTASIFTVIFCACVSAQAQGAAVGGGSGQPSGARSKEDDIRKLLYATGAGKLGEQLMGQMFTTIRGTMKQVPESVWDEITGEFKAEFTAEKLIEMNVPIYSRYYSHDEIRQLISFYESPLGRKVTSVTPQLFREAYEVGTAHGHAVMQRIFERLRSKGYKTPVAD